MSTHARPQFRKLSSAESEAILARNHVGRLAYALAGRVDIEPLHYVYRDGWIYGRTSQGAKLDATGNNFYGWWPVAFEVDEIEGLFQWRSVVVHGGIHTAPPEGEAWETESEVWQDAVRTLRTLIPETFSANDPTPFRSVLFRISVTEVTGREAVPPAHSG